MQKRAQTCNTLPRGFSHNSALCGPSGTPVPTKVVCRRGGPPRTPLFTITVRFREPQGTPLPILHNSALQQTVPPKNALRIAKRKNNASRGADSQQKRKCRCGKIHAHSEEIDKKHHTAANIKAPTENLLFHSRLLSPPPQGARVGKTSPTQRGLFVPITRERYLFCSTVYLPFPTRGAG